MGKLSGYYKAIVKDNTDKLGMGRMLVYIPEFGGDPTDENNWYLANYMSPYAGQTNPYSNTKGGKEENQSQDSYGIWMNSYHPENEVIVAFVNGDASKAVVMGSLFGQNMSSSIGGYPSNKSTEGKIGGVNPPTVEYNKRDEDINPRKPERPTREILTKQLWKQGLFADFKRGQTDTSPMRDPVPQFQSFKTPNGGMFAIDDGKISVGGAGVDGKPYPTGQGASPYMRMRTTNGAQFLMNSDCGFIYMNSKDGNSWIQIANNGIQIYTKGNLNVRAQGGYNQRSDANHNIEVMGNMNIRSVGSVNIETDTGFHNKTTGNHLETSAGVHSSKSSLSQRYESGGEYTEKAGSNIYENSGGNIHDNSISASSAIEADTITTAPGIDRAHTENPRVDTGQMESASGPTSPTSQQTSLPSGQFVTHEPWGNQPQACGGPSSYAEETEGAPTEEQPLGDGSTDEVPVEEGPISADPNAISHPLAGEGRQSSDFGSRVAPTAGASTDHGGIDIATPIGTPVYAVADGVVTDAGTQAGGGGFGNRVYIDHGNNYGSVSAHLNRYVVSNGQHVKKGQLIGYSGNTGTSTGPHLHFGISHGGKLNWVNPSPFLNGSQTFGG